MISPNPTFVTWLWKRTQPNWKRDYNAGHVNAAQYMLAKHYSLPHSFACVTDMPDGIKGRRVPLWEQPYVPVQSNLPNCYKRLYMFSADRFIKEQFGPLLISIDLDMVILGDITPLFNPADSFRICKGTVCPYNGAMWQLKPGARREVWDLFDPLTSPQLSHAMLNENGTHYYGSDQAHISRMLPCERTWTEEDGVYQWPNIVANYGGNPPANAKIIFFPGKHKPWMNSVRKRSELVFDTYYNAYEEAGNR